MIIAPFLFFEKDRNYGIRVYRSDVYPLNCFHVQKCPKVKK